MSSGKLNLKNIHARKREYKDSSYQRKYEFIGKNDVMLNFPWLGNWAGHRAKEMAVDHDGRKTLRWILEHNFPDDLKSMLEKILEDTY